MFSGRLFNRRRHWLRDSILEVNEARLRIMPLQRTVLSRTEIAYLGAMLRNEIADGDLGPADDVLIPGARLTKV
jgi:hypothetical protein